MRKISALLIFMAFIGWAPQASAETQIVGSVKSITVKVTKNSDHTLKRGDQVALDDLIETQDESYITISFIDDTKIDLGENAALEIDRYVYSVEDADDNAATFNITKGAFHYVSGFIAKTDEPDVKIGLDFGSIGIRGTKIWRDMKENEDGQMTCRVYLEDGEAVVYNDQGRTRLKHGDGTKIAGNDAEPTPSKAWSEKNILEIKSKTQPPE